MAKQDSITESNKDAGSQAVSQDLAAQQQSVAGRGVFVVESVPVGVAVRTAFLTEDGRLLNIPAAFPDVHYALAQIDELRQMVMQRFAQAAQIGSQIIAQQMAQQAAQGNGAAAAVTSGQTPSADESSASPRGDSDKDRPKTLNS